MEAEGGILMLAFKPHVSSVFQVAFAPDGATIATCGSMPDVCVSDAATGDALWRWTDPKSFRVLGLAYSPDGTRLAAVGWTEVLILNATTGAQVSRYPARGHSVAYTPDGTGVVTGSVRGEHAIQTDLRTGHAARLDGPDHSPMFTRFRFSPDGNRLAALGSSISVVDTQTQTCVARVTISHFTYGIGVLAFHPTAPVLVYSEAAKLIAYDPDAGVALAERKRSKKFIQDGAFVPNGKHLITVSNEATAVLWETTGWTEVRAFAWDIGPLKSVAVAQDGSRGVCASDRGRVVVWDLDEFT